MEKYSTYIESIHYGIYQLIEAGNIKKDLIILIPPYCKKQLENDIVKANTGGWDVGAWGNKGAILNTLGYKIRIKLLGYEDKLVMFENTYNPKPIIMELPYSEQTVFQTT